MHAGAMEAREDFEVVAACDVDGDRLEAARGRFGCSLYEDYRRMLEAERLDLVAIVTRSDQHCDMTCDCLSAGVNVLVTKPWARNEAEAQRMVEAAERSGKLQPGRSGRCSTSGGCSPASPGGGTGRPSGGTAGGIC
jgi:predicted dehydrogenase